MKSEVKVFAAFLSVAFLFSSAFADCVCTADPYSKKYSEYRKTWYGSVRAWNCAYTCTDGSDTETLIGSHRDRYYGDETGLEGICDGLIYKYEYIIVMNRFIYAYQGIGPVDPQKSSSKDLNDWAKIHKCQ